MGITFKFLEEERFQEKKDLNGGNWKYYDVDLDAVRETLAKDMFIAGTKLPEDNNPEKFKEHQDLIEAISMLRKF